MALRLTPVSWPSTPFFPRNDTNHHSQARDMVRLGVANDNTLADSGHHQVSRPSKPIPIPRDLCLKL